MCVWIYSRDPLLEKEEPGGNGITEKAAAQAPEKLAAFSRYTTAHRTSRVYQPQIYTHSAVRQKERQGRQSGLIDDSECVIIPAEENERMEIASLRQKKQKSERTVVMCVCSTRLYKSSKSRAPCSKRRDRFEPDFRRAALLPVQ